MEVLGPLPLTHTCPAPSALLAVLTHSLLPVPGGAGGAGGFRGVRTAFSQPDLPPSAPPLPTHGASSAAPDIAATTAPAAALTHSPAAPGATVVAAGGPSGDGDETPPPWWADWDRRCVHALRSVREPSRLFPVPFSARGYEKEPARMLPTTHNQRVVGLGAAGGRGGGGDGTVAARCRRRATILAAVQP